MNSITTVLNNVIDFVGPNLTCISIFKRTTGNKTTVMNRKYYCIEQRFVTQSNGQSRKTFSVCQDDFINSYRFHTFFSFVEMILALFLEVYHGFYALSISLILSAGVDSFISSDK